MLRTLTFKILVSVVSLTLLVYAALAGYLWWSESKVPNNLPIESLRVNSKKPHHMVLIDSGLESLKRRVEAIDRARQTIELEYFIYELDLAAQIISYKLIEAAERGVQVKILVDASAPVFKLRPEYAQFLNKSNIQVKYYNTAPLVNFIGIQHRSHRKFLIIDNQILITGGRNIGNDYFDLSGHYNFLDSDIEISGPIIEQVRESFMRYWNSEMASRPELPEAPANLDFVDLKKIQATLRFLNRQYYPKQTHVCHDVDFVTDSPGIATKNRKIYPYLVEKLKQIKNEINVESPYFVLREDGLNLIKDLYQRKIKQTYLTNGLYSTDAYYTVSALLPSLGDLKKYQANLYLYNGKHLTPQNKYPQKISKRWGLHAKRAVFDGKHTLIGTYNIDPRSANLNSEVIFACNNNPQIAQAMLKSMTLRRQQAWKLFTKDKWAISQLTHQSSFEQWVKFYLVLPLANLFNFLL